jgi:choline-sulfatase
MEHEMSRPNVLILMTDQHRADWMTCVGNSPVPTPNLDRIAKRGVRFENAYCPYPVCTASRMALMTGMYAHSTGAINNSDRLDWRYRTMAHHFSEHGYLTGLIGKMHFNDAHNHGLEYYMSVNDWLMYLGPKAQHYANEIANHALNDRFFETVFDTGSGFPDVSHVWENDQSPWVGLVDRFDFSSMASALEPEDHLDMFIARETVKFLKAYQDQPFCLTASFMKPHPPFYPPREWAERFRPEAMDLLPIGDISKYPEHIQQRVARTQGMGEKRIRAHKAGYMGNLAFVDHCIGQVLDGLDALGLWDNTIVVYTSDHGEMGGEHGIYQKFCMFDPAVKVPLMVSYPPRIPQGQVTEALTEYFGLYPTLSDLAGLPAPDRTTVVDFEGACEEMDAIGFANVLCDPDAIGPEVVFSEHGLRSDLASYLVRSKQFKYVHHVGGSCHELYDLENDAGEFHNLIGEAKYQSVVKDLLAQLFAWYDPDENVYGRQ